jgi:Glutathione S-transferase, N-terminal domain
MIELYYWPTPNGHKITLFLEEAALDYTIKPVNISAGDQFKPEFLAFSPNNRMPAISDRDPVDHGEAVTVFESGAILLYLAEKTGLFLPTDRRGRKTVTEWLFWQMGGLGPMAGQNHLSLSGIKSEHTDGVVRRELASAECVRRPERPAVSAHPSSGIDECEPRCNTAYKKGVSGAGVAHRIRRHDQGIPVGSSRSAVQHVHSAVEIVARLVGHECPWREAAV